MIKVIHRFSIFIYDLLAAFVPLIVIMGTIVVASLSLVFQLDIFQGLVIEKHIIWMFYGAIAMEVTKWAFVFLGGLDNNRSKVGLKSVRVFLIAISVVCSILYCMHSLYNPRQEDVLAQKTAQVQELNAQEVARAITAFDRESDGIRSYYDEKLNTLFALREKEKLNVVGGTFLGPRYKSLQSEITRLEAELNAAFQDVEGRRQDALSELSATLKQGLEEAKTQAYSFTESGHPMLVKALRTLNIGRDFSDMQYVILVLFLALLITASIESIIYRGFTYLANEVNQTHTQARQNIKAVNVQKMVTNLISNIYKVNTQLTSSLGQFTQKHIANVSTRFQKLFK